MELVQYISNNEDLEKVWLAALFNQKKHWNKRQINRTSIARSVHALINGAEQRSHSQPTRYTQDDSKQDTTDQYNTNTNNNTNNKNDDEWLVSSRSGPYFREFGRCLVGISRIHNKQIDYLTQDCKQALSHFTLRISHNSASSKRQKTIGIELDSKENEQNQLNLDLVPRKNNTTNYKSNRCGITGSLANDLGTDWDTLDQQLNELGLGDLHLDQFDDSLLPNFSLPDSSGNNNHNINNNPNQSSDDLDLFRDGLGSLIGYSQPDNTSQLLDITQRNFASTDDGNNEVDIQVEGLRRDDSSTSTIDSSVLREREGRERARMDSAIRRMNRDSTFYSPASVDSVEIGRANRSGMDAVQVSGLLGNGNDMLPDPLRLSSTNVMMDDTMSTISKISLLPDRSVGAMDVDGMNNDDDDDLDLMLNPMLGMPTPDLGGMERYRSFMASLSKSKRKKSIADDSDTPTKKQREARRNDTVINELVFGDDDNELVSEDILDRTIREKYKQKKKQSRKRKRFPLSKLREFKRAKDMEMDETQCLLKRRDVSHVFHAHNNNLLTNQLSIADLIEGCSMPLNRSGKFQSKVFQVISDRVSKSKFQISREINDTIDDDNDNLSVESGRGEQTSNDHDDSINLFSQSVDVNDPSLLGNGDGLNDGLDASFQPSLLKDINGTPIMMDKQRRSSSTMMGDDQLIDDMIGMNINDDSININNNNDLNPEMIEDIAVEFSSDQESIHMENMKDTNLKFKMKPNEWGQTTKKLHRRLDQNFGNELSFDEFVPKQQSKELAATAFYHLLLFASHGLIDVDQPGHSYDSIGIVKTDEFERHKRKSKRMSDRLSQGLSVIE